MPLEAALAPCAPSSAWVSGLPRPTLRSQAEGGAAGLWAAMLLAAVEWLCGCYAALAWQEALQSTTPPSRHKSVRPSYARAKGLPSSFSGRSEQLCSLCLAQGAGLGRHS